MPSEVGEPLDLPKKDRSMVTADRSKELRHLKSVDVRSIWGNEARKFTPWLADHLDIVAEAIGVDLEFSQTEAHFGDFQADIVATEVGTGLIVLIENQLEPTDHSHLGQLLTYAAGANAKALVWISPEFRPEHQAALDWLNRNTNTALGIFGLQLEVWSIADSPPAPRLSVVSAPNEWQKPVPPGEITDRARAYNEFFGRLIEEFKKAYPGVTRARSSGGQSWISVPAGKSGFNFAWMFKQGGRFAVELYVDLGEQGATKRSFDLLSDSREEIEEQVECQIEWDRMDDRRASRIFVARDGDIFASDTKLRELHEWGLKLMPRFRDVFVPRIAEII